MFTFVYALGRMNGAEHCLAACAICLCLACIIAFAVRTNRGKRAFLTAVGVAISAGICDLVWFLIFFPNGEYMNRGIQSVYTLLLYPLCLAVGIAIVSYINKLKLDS